MKTRLLSLALVTLLLAGCQTVESRIQQKPNVYASLDQATQEKIKQGIIGIGYTPDMVYLALGAPNEKREKVTAEGRSETWIYGSYYDDYDPVMLGYHRRYFGPYMGGYRYYYRPAFGYGYFSNFEERVRVIFKEGKVAVIDQSMD
ncbi:MAG: hypothetical protein ACHQ5A_15365 [Opitutales bacterium]